MPAERCPLRGLPSPSILGQLATSRFRQHQRKNRGHKESAGGQKKGRADTQLDGQSADGEWRDGRDSPPGVITKSHGRSANLPWKDFAGDGGIAGKKSCSRSEERRVGK